MPVSQLKNGILLPHITAQTSAHTMDHTSVATLQILTTHVNMLHAGKVSLLDVLPALQIWNSTRNGMHACMKENSKLNPPIQNTKKFT